MLKQCDDRFACRLKLYRVSLYMTRGSQVRHPWIRYSKTIYRYEEREKTLKPEQIMENIEFTDIISRIFKPLSVH